MSQVWYNLNQVYLPVLHKSFKMTNEGRPRGSGLRAELWYHIYQPLRSGRIWHQVDF